MPLEAAASESFLLYRCAFAIRFISVINLIFQLLSKIPQTSTPFGVWNAGSEQNSTLEMQQKHFPGY